MIKIIIIIKQGHPGALRLLGYSPNVEITVSEIDLGNKHPSIGEDITFSFIITSREAKPCKLMIDYTVYFIKANGKQVPMEIVYSLPKYLFSLDFYIHTR